MLSLFLTFILLSLRMSGAQEAAKGSPQAGVEVDLSDENPEVAPMDGLQGGFQPPSIEQLLSMVDTMEGLSDADREDLKQQLLQQQNMGVPAPEPSGLTSEALILLAALSLIIFIFVFFGYKLYKSLKDKERKRDEKRKLKQQKKKK
ncbi:hypothetical protein R5R35_010755 [Gryllus longicercus]|uniref:Accessory gland protein n=1 Tax=Gryllus longicercus TaxID=2509291 RepID=A0AAN9V8R2_9ORTH